MRPNSPKSGDSMRTYGIATVSKSPSSSPASCRTLSASLSSAIARGAMKISLALSTTRTRTP